VNAGLSAKGAGQRGQTRFLPIHFHGRVYPVDAADPRAAKIFEGKGEGQKAIPWELVKQLLQLSGTEARD
jgi:hypothetical protein